MSLNQHEEYDELREEENTASEDRHLTIQAVREIFARRVVAFRPEFSRIGTGTEAGPLGRDAALMLAQGFWLFDASKDPEGWFTATQEEIEEATTLTGYDQRIARQKLIARGLWTEEKRGDTYEDSRGRKRKSGGRLFYKVEIDALAQALSDLVENGPRLRAEKEAVQEQVKEYRAKWLEKQKEQKRLEKAQKKKKKEPQPPTSPSSAQGDTTEGDAAPPDPEPVEEIFEIEEDELHEVKNSDYTENAEIGPQEAPIEAPKNDLCSENSQLHGFKEVEFMQSEDLEAPLIRQQQDLSKVLEHLQQLEPGTDLDEQNQSAPDTKNVLDVLSLNSSVVVNSETALSSPTLQTEEETGAEPEDDEYSPDAEKRRFVFVDLVNIGCSVNQANALINEFGIDRVEMALDTNSVDRLVSLLPEILPAATPTSAAEAVILGELADLELLKRMEAIGVKPAKTRQDLLARLGPQTIARVLDFTPYRNPRDPASSFVGECKAILEGRAYGPPANLPLELQKRYNVNGKGQPGQEGAPTASPVAQARAASLEKTWNALDAETRRIIEGEARYRLSVLGDSDNPGGPTFEAMRNAILQHFLHDEISIQQLSDLDWERTLQARYGSAGGA